MSLGSFLFLKEQLKDIIIYSESGVVRTFLKVYMELGSYFLFLQEQIKDIIIIRDSGLVLLSQVELMCSSKRVPAQRWRRSLYWGHSLVSCWVTRHCDRMGLGQVGWSWLEDAGGET
jgi:hypothetical protein